MAIVPADHIGIYEAERLCNDMQELLAAAPEAIIVNHAHYAKALEVSKDEILRRFACGANELLISDIAELAANAGYRFEVVLSRLD